MGGNPWFCQQLAEERRADYLRAAAAWRLAAIAHRAPRNPVGDRPGAGHRVRHVLFRRIGRLLVVAGYRVGGVDVLVPLPAGGRRASSFSG